MPTTHATDVQPILSRWKDEMLRLLLSICQSRSGALVLLLLTLVGICTTMAGNAFYQFLADAAKGKPADFRDLIIAICGALMVLALAVLAQVIRQRHSAVTENTHSSLAAPRSVLVFFVSKQHLIPMNEPLAESGAIKIGDTEFPRQSIMDDAQLMNEKFKTFSWEMLLRGIYPHHRAGTLNRVYLIGSTPGGDTSGQRLQDRGTRPMLPLCQALLQAYLPGVTIIPWRASPQELKALDEFTMSSKMGLPPHECDFEMIQHVSRELDALIDHDRRLHATEESSICIDITGGQKPSSAAAVLVSLNRRVSIQYVQTGGPKEAHSYDINFTVGPDRLLQNPLASS